MKIVIIIIIIIIVMLSLVFAHDSPQQRSAIIMCMHAAHFCVFYSIAVC